MLLAISSFSSRFQSHHISRSLRLLPITLLAASGLAGGCTLTRTTATDCRTNSECSDAFGFGFACNTDGLCEEAQPTARCEKTYPENLFARREDYRDLIVFGNLMDRSNSTHVAREQAAQLAYKEASAEGGVDGHEFGAVFCTIEADTGLDDLSREDAAVASARFLADTLGLPAILGPSASGDTQKVFQDTQLKATGALVISPAATSPALDSLDPADVSDEEPGLLWRTAPSDALQGAVIASDMMTVDHGRTAAVTKVAAIHAASDAYGDGLYAVFASEFQARGGDLPMELPFTNETELNAAITTAEGLQVDEVLFISSQADEIKAFLNGAANHVCLGETPDSLPKGLFLTDAAANEAVLTASLTSCFPQVRGTRQRPLDRNDDPVFANFVTAYSTANSGQDVGQYSYAANAYDAAWLLVYGAAWALLREQGVLNGQNIARGLRRVSSGSRILLQPGNWVEGREAFRAGNSINVSGASGELDYDPDTEEIAGDIEVWSIEGTTPIGIY